MGQLMRVATVSVGTADIVAAMRSAARWNAERGDVVVLAGIPPFRVQTIHGRSTRGTGNPGPNVSHWAHRTHEAAGAHACRGPPPDEPRRHPERPHLGVQPTKIQNKGDVRSQMPAPGGSSGVAKRYPEPPVLAAAGHRGIRRQHGNRPVQTVLSRR